MPNLKYLIVIIVTDIRQLFIPYPVGIANIQPHSRCLHRKGNFRAEFWLAGSKGFESKHVEESVSVN